MEDADTGPRIEALIRLMRDNGLLKSAAVEQAFRDVPRHLFLPDEPVERVYKDIAIPTKMSDQGVPISSSSQPSMMAIMLEQLELQPGMRVLEIGAGTGYNAALMADLVGESGSVTTVDIQPDLIEQARANLARAGFERVQTVAADGGEGYSPGAPYDRIILTVGSWVITPAWREQVKDGGRIVLPLALFGQWGMKSIAFERRGDELVSLSLWDCGFMPLQGAFAVPPSIQTPTGPDDRLTLNSLRPLPVDGRTFSEWLSVNGGAHPTGVKALRWELIAGFLFWLSLQSPEGIASLSATGDAADEMAPMALYGMKGPEKRAETFVKILPGSAAAITPPPEAETEWRNMEQPDENPPEQPFEVYVRQIGPSPEAAQFLVKMIRAWDAVGKPDTRRLRARGVPVGESRRLREGEFLIERPWTDFVVWYQE